MKCRLIVAVLCVASLHPVVSGRLVDGPLYEPCVYLYEAGIGADAVQAIGLDSAWVDESFALIETRPGVLESIDDALLALMRARSAVSVAEAAVRAQGLTETLRSERDEALMSLASARLAYSDALAELIEPLSELAELRGGASAMERLETVFANRGRDVPTAMLVLELTDPEWAEAERCYEIVEGGGSELLAPSDAAFWQDLTERPETLDAQDRIDNAGPVVGDLFQACGVDQ